MAGSAGRRHDGDASRLSEIDARDEVDRTRSTSLLNSEY